MRDKMNPYAVAGAVSLASIVAGCVSARVDDVRATVWLGGAIVETYADETSNRVVKRETIEFNAIQGPTKKKTEYYDDNGKKIREEIEDNTRITDSPTSIESYKTDRRVQYLSPARNSGISREHSYMHRTRHRG